jgi:hypothetical protein
LQEGRGAARSRYIKGLSPFPLQWKTLGIRDKASNDNDFRIILAKLPKLTKRFDQYHQAVGSARGENSGKNKRLTSVALALGPLAGTERCLPYTNCGVEHRIC